MKIEKLTENKIRIILKQEDFKNKSIDLKKFILTEPETQSLFLEILNKAKKEVDFDTDGHKLLIEAYFQNSDVFIFTITKYTESNTTLKNNTKKLLSIRKKVSTLHSHVIFINLIILKTFVIIAIIYIKKAQLT